jgi:PAP2 superfamily
VGEQPLKSWVVPAVAIVALEYAVALMIGLAVGFRYSIPFGAYFIASATVVVLGLFFYVADRMVVVLRFGESTADLSRFYSFAVGVFLVGLQMAVLNWTKIMLPFVNGFWADPLLARWDVAVFQTDAWRIVNSVRWASKLMDGSYIIWIPVKLSVLILLFCAPESPRKSRSILAYFIILTAGALGQYLLPAAGPVFYQYVGVGGHFADMPVQPGVAAGVKYLWQDYLSGGGHLGTGISAMPSMHVAVALWVALVARVHAPKLSPLGFIYFALVAIGSVYLGWHYASDGIVAVGITLVAWKIAGFAAKLLSMTDLGCAGEGEFLRPRPVRF